MITININNVQLLDFYISGTIFDNKNQIEFHIYETHSENKIYCVIYSLLREQYSIIKLPPFINEKSYNNRNMFKWMITQFDDWIEELNWVSKHNSKHLGL